LIATDPKHQRIRPEVRFDRLGVGMRNDGLARQGGYLRRKGASHEEILADLLESNQRRCDPPLDDSEVRRIAASVARYPVGGPDPLETAWRQPAVLQCDSNRDKFLELCRQLQCSRRERPIVLPLMRIAELMNLHFTTIAEFRKEAVKAGILLPISENYVPHRRAGEYWFRGLP
jgi:hypothetical protein